MECVPGANAVRFHPLLALGAMRSPCGLWCVLCTRLQLLLSQPSLSSYSLSLPWVLHPEQRAKATPRSLFLVTVRQAGRCLDSEGWVLDIPSPWAQGIDLQPQQEQPSCRPAGKGTSPGPGPVCEKPTHGTHSDCLAAKAVHNPIMALVIAYPVG